MSSQNPKRVTLKRTPEPISGESKKRKTPSLRRVDKKKDAQPSILCAYDFETTRIEAGTPRPLYITAYSEELGLQLENHINDMNHLHDLLKQHFLTDNLSGVKFIAWNANNFDAYFIAAALVGDTDYIIRPYLTRSNALRGLRINKAADIKDDGTFPKNAISWEFLDGIAMLGLVGTPLSKFLANFAPDFQKLTGTIDFEAETFDIKNQSHRDYALRDSVGLYHGMKRAQNILIENFNQALTVTMGGACIKIFSANIPHGININSLEEKPLSIIREYAMRGGFCYCVGRYRGKVWKYDLNQAYAAAMRETNLPCGNSYQTNGVNKFAKVFIVRIVATKKDNKIPFYYRTEINGKLKSCFGFDRIENTWITSTEYNQLIREGWTIKVYESIFWDESFSMTEYVNSLEKLRTTCEGGPNGPIGTMTKAVGNHSYGKTVEQLEYIEYLISADLPPGYLPYYGDNIDPLENIYYRFTPQEQIRPKGYHKPQIGAFITAYVRMVVRRAALLAPDNWLYADTDCVIFSCDVTEKMDTDAKRYGAWKIEESGTEYQIIAKKVYRNVEKEKLNAKGLNIKRLKPIDFDKWYAGDAPMQTQVQRNNFMMAMRGAEMYRKQTRSGTRISALKDSKKLSDANVD